MTAIYAAPMLYCCDGAGCRAEAFGNSARLPEGWREWKREDHVGHLCPRCVAPEAK